MSQVLKYLRSGLPRVIRSQFPGAIPAAKAAITTVSGARDATHSMLAMGNEIANTPGVKDLLKLRGQLVAQTSPLRQLQPLNTNGLMMRSFRNQPTTRRQFLVDMLRAHLNPEVRTLSQGTAKGMVHAASEVGDLLSDGVGSLLKRGSATPGRAAQEPEKVEGTFLRRLLPAMGAGYGNVGLNLLYGKTALKPYLDGEFMDRTQGFGRMNEQLQRWLNLRGVGVGDGNNPHYAVNRRSTSANQRFQWYEGLYNKGGRKSDSLLDAVQVHAKGQYGQHFPGGIIEANLNRIHPAIFAHEAGHALQPKWMTLGGKSHSMGVLGTGLASLASMFTDDKSIANKINTAGSLAAVPMIAAELDASTRGYMLGRKLGLGRLGAAKSFLGIPTYLSTAALPWIQSAIANRVGGYDHVKSASPRWVRMLGELSEGAKARLAASLPANTTRQVSKVPFGGGGEGHVFDAFTGGGVGDSVLKNFHSLRGSKEIPGWVREQTQVMQENPDIFANVFHPTRRGWAMPRMSMRRPANAVPGAGNQAVESILSKMIPSQRRGFLRQMREAGETNGMPTRFIMPGGPKGTQHAWEISDILPNSGNWMWDSAGNIRITDPLMQKVVNPAVHRLDKMQRSRQMAAWRAEQSAQPQMIDLPAMLRGVWNRLRGRGAVA